MLKKYLGEDKTPRVSLTPDWGGHDALAMAKRTTETESIHTDVAAILLR
jgi:hypothetical protein